MNIRMTKFSIEVPRCIQNWSKEAISCKGDPICLDLAAKKLREYLDAAFPPSQKVEVESDKINYIISSVFLLSKRLAKANIGLAELDNAIATDSERIDKAVSTEILKTILDKIIAEYF
jgi:hypothetical protein